MKLYIALLLTAVGSSLREGAFAFHASVHHNRSPLRQNLKPSSSILYERNIAALQEWSTACGVQNVPGFQLTSEDGMDWQVMTTEAIATGSPVLQVPQGVLLSSTAISQENLPGVQAAVDTLSRLGAGGDATIFLLFVKFLTLMEQGEESPWFPWLNSMPHFFYNAISMTDFCYECLPPLVYRYARTEKVKFDNFLSALDKVECVSAATKQNEEVLKWVYNIVTTRSWGQDGGEKYMIPMADMFNHGTYPSVDIGFDDQGNCVVYATQDVEAGSPLLLSYGCPTNPSLLFAQYGFLDESSPATFCKITNIQPNQELKDLGFDFSRMVFYKDTGDISQEVWDVMLYEGLKNNREEQEAFYQAHMNGDEATKQAIHERHFAQTSMALKTHVDKFLEQLDELSAKSEGKDVNEHPRLPLILRHNEFVKTTFLTVKERLDPLVAQAAGVYA